MAKKRSRAQQLQKRARDKEYRIRRKLGGATTEDKAFAASVVSGVSPRLPWSEVQKLHGAALRSYEHRLRQFIDRKNTHERVISKGFATSMESSVAAYNARARAYRAHIDAIPVKWTGAARDRVKADVATQISERTLYQKDPKTGRPTGKKFSVQGYQLRGVTELPVDMLPPKDQQAARRRAESVHRMAMRTADEIRAQTKENAMKMLATMGEQDLADRLDKMTDDQLDVLFNRTNFMSNLDALHAVFDWVSDPNLVLNQEREGFDPGERWRESRKVMEMASNADEPARLIEIVSESVV